MVFIKISYKQKRKGFMKTTLLSVRFYLRQIILTLFTKRICQGMFLVLLTTATSVSLFGQTVIGTISRPGLEPWNLAVYEIGNKLLICDNATGHLLIYDCASLALQTELTIEGGVGGSSMLIDETSGRVYIPTFPGGHHVAVINAVANQLIHYIDIDTYGLEKGDSLRRLYGISTIAPFYLYVIDMNTESWQTVSLSNAGLTSGLGVNSITHEVFVGYLQGYALDIINGSTLNRTTVTGENGRYLAVNWLENKIYRTMADWSGYWIYDRDNGSSKITSCVNDATSLFFNSKSNRVYTDSEVNHEVTVIEGASDSCYQIELGVTATAVGFRYATNHVYFVGINSVKILEEITGNIITIPIDNPPHGGGLVQAIAINQTTGRVFVANDGDALNFVTVIQDPAAEPDIEISPDTLLFGVTSSQSTSSQPLTLTESPVLESNEVTAEKKVLNILPTEQTEEVASLTAPLSTVVGDLVTLVYDDGFPSSYYVWGNGKRLAVHMSPAEPCKIIAMQIYCPSGTQSYKVGAYNWTGTSPGTKLLETSIVTSNQQGWATTYVSSYNINVTGDFVASFNMIDSDAGLGFDPSNNGRAWDFDGTSWSPWNETYFIRTIVEYGAGTLDTIATMSVNNIGYQQLEINNITADQPWIWEITPTAFSVASGHSKSVTVKVSPDGLSPGTYYGSLQIACNDPDENPCMIPVKFLVAQPTGIGDDRQVVPSDYFLWQNYPNPFNPSTNIKYQIPTTTHVSLRVFDILGREVAILVDGIEQIGYKSVEFDGSRLTSGMYIYQLKTDRYVSVKKMLLLR